VKTFYKNLIITSAFLAALSADAIGPVVTDLSLNVSPQYPSAGENFTVKAKSFTFDPVRANFQWLLNGKIVSSGKGLSEQIFTASKLGSQMTIKAVATMNGGSSFGAQIIVNVADIDLIASPLTYTPLFYRGYSFASPGAVVEIYAVPHLFSGGARIAPKNLIYEWFVDGNKFSAKSGEGKNKFILDTWDAGNASYDIGLKVSSSGGSISVQKNIRIRPQNPQVLFYEINKLTGRKNLAHSSFFLRSGETLSVLAEPYFFGLASLNRAAVSWNANGNVIDTTSENPKILEVTAPENSISSTNFGSSIEDAKTIYQRAAAELTITVTE